MTAATQSSGFKKLDEWVDTWKQTQQNFFGYPINEQSVLHGFYEWYLASGMDVVNLNNAGDPTSKYNLAQGHDDRFGGDLAHIVVMQHVTKDKIDSFVSELKSSMKR